STCADPKARTARRVDDTVQVHTVGAQTEVGDQATVDGKGRIIAPMILHRVEFTARLLEKTGLEQSRYQIGDGARAGARPGQLGIERNTVAGTRLKNGPMGQKSGRPLMR